MNPLRLAIIAAPVLVATVLAACEPRVSRHGQVLDQEAVASIEPGVDHRSEVSRRLGTPSSRSLFGEDTWFYISQHRTTSVLSLPETESQTVVAIAFDSSGIVEEVAMLTIEDGIVIDPVSRATPTHGRDLGLLEQLLGNIGRFDAPGTTAQFPTP
ncbi:MAG: outer membrane protein assembly factor BamE [Alphaproteobacteria bacterium]|nr:outer membrane protein assembly factor BamE [Alphaproteobacteria bacterium]